MKTTTYSITGMHCPACKAKVERALLALTGVKRANADFARGTVAVEYDEGSAHPSAFAAAAKGVGYVLDPSPLPGPATAGNGGGWLRRFFPLLLVAAIAGIGYAVIGAAGGFELLARLGEGRVGYGLIFVIGLLAGFHCIGMCGGLVVAYSAACLRVGATAGGAAHFKYNLGRVISYAVIGAILGGIGSFFALSPAISGAIMLAAAIGMVLLGLSFVSERPWARRLIPRLPAPLARLFASTPEQAMNRGPFLVGLANGLMPCGPLQAMQLYALTTGSAFRGSASLAVYALGTVPLMFGFGAALSRLGRDRLKPIMRFSGALIIVLGLVMAARSLANFGVTLSGGAAAPTAPVAAGEFQEVRMAVTYSGYSPSTLAIKPGIPVRWIIDGKGITGCTDAIQIPSLGIKRDLTRGETVIEFTPPAGVKEIPFSCWMRMVWGKFVVTGDATSNTAPAAAVNDSGRPPQDQNLVCGLDGCGVQ